MTTQQGWKRWILKACLALAAVLLLPASVLAQGMGAEGTVAPGEVLDRNVVLSGPTVVMDGVINGDLLAVGDQVTINGTVNGNLVIAAREALLNGPVEGSLYSAAFTQELGEQAQVGRDATLAVGRLQVRSGSAVLRDLNLLALEMLSNVEVGRNTHAVVGPINLAQGLYSLLKGQPWTPPAQRPSSLRSPDSPVSWLGLSSPRASRPVWVAAPLLLAPARLAQQTAPLQSWGLPLLRSLASLLILGLLVAWLAPAQLSLTTAQARTAPWKALLTGLLVIVCGALLVLVAVAVCLMLAVFLDWISLSTLAFLVGATGLMATGLAATVWWLCIAYFSKLVVAALVGRLLLGRLLPRYAGQRVLPVVVGVVLYALLASIPYLGGAVALLSTLLGLGALWLAASPFSPAVRQPAAAEQPAAVEQPAVVEPPASDSPEMGLLPQG